MSGIRIRAKSIVKLSTGKSDLDYEYAANSPVEEPLKDLLHALVQRDGTSGAKEFVMDFLGKYEPDYQGLKR